MRRIVVTSIQKKLLTKLIHASTNPQRIVLRCGIVLDYAALHNQSAISRNRHIDRNTVDHWIVRWHAAQQRLLEAEAAYEAGEISETLYAKEIEVALADAPRPGAPATFSDSQKKQILAVASEEPEKEGVPITHWTHSSLAEYVRHKGIVQSISPAHLGRFLKEGSTQTSSE